jgi:hypothetical protein
MVAMDAVTIAVSLTEGELSHLIRLARGEPGLQRALAMFERAYNRLLQDYRVKAMLVQ